MKSLFLITLMITFSMYAEAQLIAKVEIKTVNQFECYLKANYNGTQYERWHYPEMNLNFVAKAKKGDTVKVILIQNPNTACADTTHITIIGQDERLKVKPRMFLNGEKHLYDTYGIY